MQPEHRAASSEEKGAEHIPHEGPEYLFIPDQQPLQKGACLMLSVALPQEGQ